jgi:ubiquinone/menaquinone biosynthesis C-methylase UbiE
MSNTQEPGPLGVPAVWDAIAETYGQDVMHFFARYSEEALRIVAPDRSAHILDIGSGPGTLTFVAAPRVARVSAVDFSSGMVDEVRRRAEREGIANVDAQVMDAQSLTFGESTFHAAFSMFAFMFFPDRARAFREMRRVLRPEGKALVGTWAPIERRPFMQVGFESLAEALPELPPMPKGDLQQPDSCIKEMTNGGFRGVTTHTFTASVRVESAERYLQLMERSGAPFAALRKKLGGEAWSRAYERLLDAVRRRLPEGGTDLSAEAIFSVGVR